jgi:hypothetical protein
MRQKSFGQPALPRRGCRDVGTFCGHARQAVSATVDVGSSLLGNVRQIAVTEEIIEFRSFAFY